MAFSVNDFTANVNISGGGFARANLFTVDLGAAAPAGATLHKSPRSALTNGDLLVKAAQFPGSTIAPLPVNYGGRVIKLTGFRTFDNWTITVLNDENFSYRKWFQKWIYGLAGAPNGDRDGMVRTVASGTIGGIFNAPSDLSVTALNNRGGEISKWKFINAWPTALGDITLDWGTDGIQEYTVEFAYEYWTHGHNDARAAGSTSKVTEDSNVVSGRTVAT